LLAARARRLRIRTDAFRRNAAAGLRPRVHEAAVPVQADLVRCGEAAQPRRAGERAGAADSRRREAGAAARDAEGDPEGPAGRLTGPRAVVVVTGSELVRGDRTDLNGPFLARELLALGVEPARIVIVGDREDELAGALDEGLRADLCVVSGGLGPTHDDRTVELVARTAGLGLRLDGQLEAEIGRISRRFAQRLGRPYVDFQQGVRKQATIPVGALSLGLAGTAPGLVLETGSTVVVVLPGPPAELQRLWAEALKAEPLRRVLTRARPPDLRLLRFFGASES